MAQSNKEDQSLFFINLTSVKKTTTKKKQGGTSASGIVNFLVFWGMGELIGVTREGTFEIL